MSQQFQLVSPYQPSGDQPQAIAELVAGLNAGMAAQTLLGATGTGKTYTVANVIQAVNKPTLVLAHNKTLAGQLYGELKEFFPRAAVALPPTTACAPTPRPVASSRCAATGR